MEPKTDTWITGAVLLGIALIWSVLVVQTIPTGQGAGDVGPRAFPLLLGIILACFSVVMIVKSRAKEEPSSKSPMSASEKKLDIEVTVSVFLVIMAYGFLFSKVGFLLATLIVVVVMMIGILKFKRPVLIASMAVGLAFGCWLVFGKLIGAYLPHGTWISLG